MAHNLFNKRFYYRDDQNKPWHQLGVHSDGIPLTAREAYERMGPYEVSLNRVAIERAPLGVASDDPSYLDWAEQNGYKAILRHPTADDFAYRSFGIVSDEYVLVTPDDTVDTWDSVFEPNVETLGALGYGETLFITTKLPEIDVNGDEVEMYLLVDSPMRAGHSLHVRVTPIRVVCQNTLSLANAVASQSFKLRHTTGIKKQLAETMQLITQTAAEKVHTIQQFMDLLASTRVEQDLASQLFASVYAPPAQPDPDNYLNPERYQVATGKWSMADELFRNKQDAALELFNGAAHRYDESEAIQGTAWGAYNAVTELENYRAYRNQTSRAKGVMYGGRSRTMARAFTGAVMVAQGQELPARLSSTKHRL